MKPFPLISPVVLCLGLLLLISLAQVPPPPPLPPTPVVGWGPPLSPPRDDVLYNMGCAFEAQENRRRAEQAYERSVGQRPGFAEAWNHLGV